MQTKTMTVNGLKISYIKAGRGERVMLCIHGFGLSSTYFAPLIDELAKTYTVIAPDQPDFGQSQDKPGDLSLDQLAEFHYQLVQRLMLDDVTIIAHSLGTQIATKMVIKFPDKLSNLILMCPTINPQEQTFPQQMFRYIQSARREQSSEIRISMQDARQAGLPRLLKTVRQAMQDRIADRLPDIQAPTLVLAGDNDPLCPVHWAEEVASLLPYSQLNIIKGGDHTFHFDQPAKTAQLIRQFIASENNMQK